MLLLPPLPVEGAELWLDCCAVEWGTGAPLEKTEPTDSLDALADDDIMAGAESLLDPERSSGRNSEDEDDGARVPTEDPTG